ncbi:hypothetical protein [Myceligenerans indicum]|uniref:Resolvase/invertase-type recombinase catalytic domain-containing protein n=1 Tax=Myceligenerans indicum TaxID=2593663 RepID=A0ABS1LIY1_9MICO|nr:hypothetical protein [Myceligenerans indicum]MBL0886200.1 hypothetical protein [Myceligenerans indicum]
MNAPSPVVVAYVCAREDDELDAQRNAVTQYARAEGLALAQVVTDRFDTFTISQVVQAVRFHDASLLVLPTDARLASARTRLVQELEPDGAACTVLGDTPDQTAGRARLTDALPHRTPRTTTTETAP